ncbi:DUF6338 family protein [Amycolatopsis sp. cg5]|uniref:DUF6338 family protein n=1 Tax=Amycolatopsis sp. cg5 TaxID=3238802 RepID=UPI00352571F4
MPSTLTGLLLFVTLLLPGFAYLVGRERVGTSRRASPLRETVSIVAASVSAELAVIVGLWPLWHLSIDVDAMVRGPAAYTRDHYVKLTLWALSMLLLATALAFAAATQGIRKWFQDRTSSQHAPARWLGRIASGNYPHDSIVSGWWVLFEKWSLTSDIQVGCNLEDGSYFQGVLGSHSSMADETPDRDLILKAPIVYRPAGSKEAQPYPCSAVCVSASRIMALFVTYSDPIPLSEVAAGAEEAAGAAEEGSASAPSSQS